MASQVRHCELQGTRKGAVNVWVRHEHNAAQRGIDGGDTARQAHASRAQQQLPWHRGVERHRACACAVAHPVAEVDGGRRRRRQQAQQRSCRPLSAAGSWLRDVDLQRLVCEPHGRDRSAHAGSGRQWQQQATDGHGQTHLNPMRSQAGPRRRLDVFGPRRPWPKNKVVVRVDVRHVQPGQRNGAVFIAVHGAKRFDGGCVVDGHDVQREHRHGALSAAHAHVAVVRHGHRQQVLAVVVRAGQVPHVSKQRIDDIDGPAQPHAGCRLGGIVTPSRGWGAAAVVADPLAGSCAAAAAATVSRRAGRPQWRRRRLRRQQRQQRRQACVGPHERRPQRGVCAAAVRGGRGHQQPPQQRLAVLVAVRAPQRRVRQRQRQLPADAAASAAATAAVAARAQRQRAVGHRQGHLH